MNLSRSILMSSLLLLPLAAVADEVTSESVDRKRAECPMDTRGEVRLVRQVSRTACVEGQNWGLFKHSVWVDGGCSAVFASGGNLQDSGQSASSSAASGSGASPNQVTCESVGNRQVECPMNTRGAVRMVRQLSKSACTEGVSWGLFKHSVWVKDGCRGVFAVDAGGNAGGGDSGTASRIASDDAAYQGNDRAPAAAIRACNEFADQGYDGTLVAQNAMKPGYWELILRFEEYRYVCNVSSDGRVSSVDKLN